MWSGISLQVISWGNGRIALMCFPSLRGHTLTLPVIWCLKPLFCVFSYCSRFLMGEFKSDFRYSILVESSSQCIEINVKEQCIKVLLLMKSNWKYTKSKTKNREQEIVWLWYLYNVYCATYIMWCCTAIKNHIFKEYLLTWGCIGDIMFVKKGIYKFIFIHSIL